MTASLLYASSCTLGEAPMWHDGRKSCFWADICEQRLFEYNWLGQTTKSWKLDFHPSLIVQDENDHLVLALNGGLARFNTGSGDLHWLLDIEKDQIGHRCNDGACDQQGRLWVGTLDKTLKQGAGTLFCVDQNLKLQKKIEHATIPNGLVWTADNKKMYFIDSPTQTVQSFFYNGQTGNIIFDKVIIRIPEEMGTPDGMCMDAEGMLWTSHWGGFGVYRWNPSNAQLIDRIHLPVPNVSSCAFVGEGLDHLLITTARQDLSAEELAKYPESGHVFLARPRVSGKKLFKCKL